MKSKLIVHMSGKQTKLQKRTRNVDGSVIDSKTSSGKDDGHDFTYDFSYWSFDANDPMFVPQQQVYEDLGKDVIDCAFQGNFYSYSCSLIMYIECYVYLLPKDTTPVFSHTAKRAAARPTP